nr:class I SAM-dependent methyltransferase [Xenorhabdus bovienii]
MQSTILDMCCGSRMLWFDRNNPNVIFCDFRSLPFASNTFQLVVFDPPHLERAGENGWQRKKYSERPKNLNDILTTELNNIIFDAAWEGKATPAGVAKVILENEYQKER